MTDIQGPDDIKLLIDSFYFAVRKDELLGPIFQQKIPGDWAPHLQVMYSFWNSVLFASGGYRGNPFMKHAGMPIYSQHFERWIVLFHQTIDGLFAGSVADDAKQKAVKMSLLFQYKLNDIRAGGTTPLF
ncbi:MAG: group III truncated hemoglobin [Chitinophagaceae bacterium]